MKRFDYKFRALGTDCSISVVSKSDNLLDEMLNICYEKIISFENEFSRFKNDSSLSRLNKFKKLEVSDDFLSLLYKSKIVYKLTSGYFNPLVDVRRIGYVSNFYDNNFKKIEIKENLNFDNVRNYGNILELQKNMNIDFGGIAKGYLAEKIGVFLTENGFGNNLVNIGGDIYASGTNLDDEKWQIAISSPFSEDDVIDIVEISNASISTSGTYLRNWKIGKEKYHHIMNPYSSSQERELISATVIDDRGYMSDSIATACIAMGKEKALDFCRKNGIRFLFVLKNGEVIKEI